MFWTNPTPPMSRLQCKGSAHFNTPVGTSGRSRIQITQPTDQVALETPPQRAVVVEINRIESPSYDYVICFHASCPSLRPVNQVHYERLVNAAKQLRGRE